MAIETGTCISRRLACGRWAERGVCGSAGHTARPAPGGVCGCGRSVVSLDHGGAAAYEELVEQRDVLVLVLVVEPPVGAVLQHGAQHGHRPPRPDRRVHPASASRQTLKPTHYGAVPFVNVQIEGGAAQQCMLLIV